MQLHPAFVLIFRAPHFITTILIDIQQVSSKNEISSGLSALASGTTIRLLGGVAITGYCVAPKTIWQEISTWNFTFGVKSGSIGASIYMLITSISVRHVPCRFVCAAGFMQMLLGWVSPVSLRIRMDTARKQNCTDCRGCDRPA
jgi:polyferredoxin